MRHSARAFTADRWFESTAALDFHNPLVGKEEDWRLRGQEDYLQGATLLRKQYRAWSEDWEHDHCEFCWAKFMDPHFSPEHERFIAENPDVLTEGYAVQDRRPDDSGGARPGIVRKGTPEG